MIFVPLAFNRYELMINTLAALIVWNDNIRNLRLSTTETQKFDVAKK